MRRKLLNVVAALSLVLCAATVFLWVRSYIYNESLHWYGQGREMDFMSSHGQAAGYRVWSATITDPDRFTFYQFPNPTGLDGRAALLKADTNLHSTGPFLGFGIFLSKPSHLGTFIEIWLPWWFIAVLSAALPAAAIRHWAVRRRVGEGCCAACGYDLRATPDRCPECGALSRPPHNPPMHRTGSAV